MATYLRRLFVRSRAENWKKVVVLTGCDTGLGFSLARRCWEDGLIVAAGCYKKGKGFDELRNIGVHVFPLDVTKTESVNEALQFVQSILRQNNGTQLQAVVNNAGILVFGELEWQTPRIIDQQIQVNLLGPINMARTFLPLLQQHQGRLINIVSHCALTGLPALSIYGATKAAILNWNDSLRIEQSKYGVKVISIMPGAFFGESNIMANQAVYASEMFNEMSAEIKQKHEQYFHKINAHVTQIPTPKEPTKISDEGLHQKLLHSMLAPSPKTEYKHEPIRYTLYHAMFKILPTKLRDRVVERFVKLPNYD